MALDISGLNFFMPVFVFLFVFVIVYALIVKTKIIGDNKSVNVLISLIAGIIFMSFSSLELYVRTILPWFIVLLVIVFLILMIGMFTSKKWEVGLGFSWIIVIILIIIFLIVAIKVFNPVFHPELGITSGNGMSLLEQAEDYFNGGLFGSVLLIIVAGIVAWLLTK